MVEELRKSLIVLKDALDGVISALDYYDEKLEYDGDFEGNHETPSDEPDNVFDDENRFYIVTPCDPNRGDEFDYYLTSKNEIAVFTKGGHDNVTFASSQIVNVPDGCDVKKIYHVFENGNLVVIIPKIKNVEFPLLKKHRPTDFNYLHQKRDKKGRFISMR